MPESLFNKVAGLKVDNKSNGVDLVSLLLTLRPAILLKRRLWHRRFPVNFVKLLKTPFIQETSGRLLLGNCFQNFLEAMCKSYSLYMTLSFSHCFLIQSRFKSRGFFLCFLFVLQQVNF